MKIEGFWYVHFLQARLHYDTKPLKIHKLVAQGFFSNFILSKLQSLAISTYKS